jgi:hypothetical protein
MVPALTASPTKGSQNGSSSLLGLVPHRELMAGEHNKIRRGQFSSIMLVFWVELGPEPGYVVGSMMMGRILLCTLTSGNEAHGRENL